MNTRDIFNRDKELRNWWIQVTTHDNFERVQMYARSAFLDLLPSKEELNGARMLEQLQMGLADRPDESQHLPSPGLHHQIEPMPSQPVHETKKPKRKK